MHIHSRYITMGLVMMQLQFSRKKYRCRYVWLNYLSVSLDNTDITFKIKRQYESLLMVYKDNRCY